MVPKVCVVSIGITSKMIAKALAEIHLPAEFVFYEMLLHEESPLPADLSMYDVLLSSGNNAQILKRRTDKPVVTISPSLYDILLACSKSLAYTKSPIIYVYRNAFSLKDLEHVANMLAVDIHFESYDNTDEAIEAKVLEFKRQGVKCIIGSGLVCEYAEKHGLHGIYLFPEESIRNSLRTASDLAVSIYQTTKHNEQLVSIVTNSKRGIMLVDSDGTVFVCNPIAAKYLGMQEKNVIGKDVTEVFDADAVSQIANANSFVQFFKEFHGTPCSIETIPILTKGEVTDRLIYMDNLTDIQNTEREFRREVWTQKGFFAKYTFGQYNSVNREFQDFLSITKSFAKTDEPIVILGETGVGKEVLAQSIHNHSNRAGKAFVAVNCAAIPENLLESELFGYSEGAFTGAKKGGKEGFFEMAHMGTIFLDEIGEMNIMIQSKLLRVIQEKQVLRVGGTKLVPFDARIIVATNKNLWQLVQDGTFRKDLYYRLNVLELEVPPLRARPDDTLMLFEDFASSLSPAMWDALSASSAELVTLLSSYSWPGNVRELENFVHMLIAYWKPGTNPKEMLDLLARMLWKKRQRFSPSEEQEPVAVAPISSFSSTGLLKSSEKRQIREALAACDGNIVTAASMLGIHRTTLWRKLKRIEKDEDAGEN